MDVKALCLRLLKAESEAEVQKIIESSPELRDPKNWNPLDNRETNYNVTTNQQASGPKAATELMTNMVDAILMKHAHKDGIDPAGPHAPKTMYEAVERFFRLKGGRLLNADTDRWLLEFASKNLAIGITGAKRKADGFPCYTFADNGEGQSPEKFEDTFLSLSKGNKKDIPFVQGKYNMGSSGVLGYCGRRWFKLIVSRRFDGKGSWGWTLMRRRPGDGMPIAEYFKLGGKNGAVPSFRDDMLFPFHKQDGSPYDGFCLSTGTIVKLYDFQIGAKFMSFRGSREALNENLVETILPFRILDFRQTPDPKRTGDRREGIDARRFCGMEFLLVREHADESESDDEDEPASAAGEKLNVALIDDPELGHIEITAIPLKKKLPEWLKPTSTNNRVFHAVNGQVQYKQTRGFLTQCGFPALKDRVVIVIDASRLTFQTHNDVWKSDREHIRETVVGERYKEVVREAIEKSDVLKELQERIAREELTLIADKQSNDLFEKLVNSDRTLANLLGARDPQIILRTLADDDKKEPFQGKYSPTVFEIEGRFRDKPIEIPINRGKPFTGKTDAENGYLIRDENPGRLYFSDESIREKFNIRQSLKDGRLTVYFTPSASRLKIGDSFEFEIGLHDDAMAAPVTDRLVIRITEEAAEAKPGKKSKNDPKPPKDESRPTVGLPKYVLLTKDGREIPDHPYEKWPEGFQDHDGGVVEEIGDGARIYKINYDNIYHLKYRQQQRGQIARDTLSQKYIIGMRIMLLGFEHALQAEATAKNNGEPAPVSEYADDFRKVAARGAAATVLTVAEHLPKLMEPVTSVEEPE